MASFLLWLIPATFSFAQSVETSIQIEPEPGDNFVHAEFHLYLPDGVETVRGLYLVLPGWNSDGSGLAKVQGLRDFCRKYRLALVSATLRSEKDPNVPRETYNYSAAQNGSGRAFEKAMARLAEQTGHPELSTVPYLVRGYSAGGQFAYGMACFQPEKVIAFSATKGGYYLSEPRPETYSIPAVIVMGENDEERRRIALQKLFDEHRREGAPWILLVEPGSGHEPGRGGELVHAFFDEVLPMRLGENGEPRLIPPSEGITVNLETGSILPPSTSPVTLATTGWLPGQESLAAWRDISQKATPSAPKG